jgi:cobalamin biosynthesis Mg chelatase CobN
VGRIPLRLRLQKSQPRRNRPPVQIPRILPRTSLCRQRTALLQGLGGEYILPGPGGDPIRNPDVLPTGKNMHALDPQSIPTEAAVKSAKVVVDRLLDRQMRDNDGQYPETIACVLWGTDNIKTYGESLAQIMWMVGVKPVPDALGRVNKLQMISHGYEGVRELSKQLVNTSGWSATAGAVDNWIYEETNDTFIKDEEMCKRLMDLNPNSFRKIVSTLLEVNGRGYWETSDENLDKLRDLYQEVEDRIEGVD